MALNLSDVIRIVGELGVRSQRLESDYKSIVNRAQRGLTERFNFCFMRDIVTATILAGETSGDLPEEWKELDTQYSPVSFTVDSATGRRNPVKIVSRAEIERMGTVMYSQPYWGYPAEYAFIEQLGGANWTINFPNPNPNSGDVTLHVAGFFYPAELVAGTDTNAMFSGGEITEALINKAKAIAYASEDETDPRAEAAEALAELHFGRARTADTKKRLSGRVLRM